MSTNQLRFLKDIVNRAVHTEYKSPKLFRLDIDGAPPDFDLFVLDMSHTPIENGNEEIAYGFKKINLPSQTEPIVLTVTLSDSPNEHVREFFKEWNAKLDNGDGTVNPPNQFLKTVRRYRIMSSEFSPTGFVETLANEWKMWCGRVGEYSESREESGRLTYPITLNEWRRA